MVQPLMISHEYFHYATIIKLKSYITIVIAICSIITGNSIRSVGFEPNR